MFRSRTAVLLLALIAQTSTVLLPSSAAHGVVSSKLVNGGFETGDLSAWQTWSSVDADANVVESPSKLGLYKGVHRKSTAYEVYTYQLVNGLTNGTYAVSANFRSSGGQVYTTFSAKNFGSTALSSNVPSAATTSWRRLQLSDVSVTNGQIEIGVYSKAMAGNWLYFDDVRLDYIAPNPAETSEGTNLVNSAGFESTTGWSSSGTAGRVVSDAQSGSASMRLGPTSGFTYQDITSGFSAGQTVILTGYGKAATQGGVALLGVQALNSSGSALSDVKTPFFATSYGKNSTTSVLPTGTVTLRVYVYKEDGDRASLVHVDDVRLYVSSGTQYYVDATNGNDSLLGTSPAQAWATLAKASSRSWAPGDTLLLKGGQTINGGLDFGSASSGTMNHPITISSYGTGGRAVINALKSHGILLQDASGFHIYGVDLTGPGSTTGVYNGIFATNNTSSTQRGLIAVDNVTISGFYLGLNVDSRRGKGFGPISILNSTTRDNFREGTNVFGYDSGGEDGDVWYSQGIFTRAYAGYVTSYNNHEWSGILLANADDAMIEHSTVYNIGGSAKGGAGPVGIWTIGTRRGTVQFNSASNVGSGNAQKPGEGDKLDGDGYDISHNNTDALYQYNLAYGNEGPGFLIDNYNVTNPTANRITLRYNVSHGNCKDNTFCGEIYTYGPVYNSNIYNNSVRVTTAGQTGIRFTGEWGSTASVTGSVAAKVRNNIISVVNGAEAVHVTAAGEGGAGYLWTDPGDISFQGNLYWADGSTLAIKDKGALYSTLASWRSETRERSGSSDSGMQADPQYATPTTVGSADSLKIGASSPAKDAGLNLSALFGVNPGAIDAFGTALPQGPGYDIGAHERP